MHFYYAFPTVDLDTGTGEPYVFVNALHIVKIETVGKDGLPGTAVPKATLTDGSVVFFDQHNFQLFCRDRLIGK